MDDVTRALEKAADAALQSMKGEFNPWLNATQREKAVANASRAAVLAFLKEMPDAYWSEPNDIGVRHGGIWTTSRLAAAIEKERT